MRKGIDSSFWLTLVWRIGRSDVSRFDELLVWKELSALIFFFNKSKLTTHLFIDYYFISVDLTSLEDKNTILLFCKCLAASRMQDKHFNKALLV